MAPLETEVQRFASALDDYEDLSVVDIGGTDHVGYWLVIQDDRTRARREICSWLDYWECIARHAVGRPADAATSPVVGGAIGRPSGAPISAAEATA